MNKKDFLTFDEISVKETSALISLAHSLKKKRIQTSTQLKGKTLAMIFEKPPFGEATVMFIPVFAHPYSQELHTLFPSPIQATFSPRSFFLFSYMVSKSASI